jgi:hypothetical protein
MELEEQLELPLEPTVEPEIIKPGTQLEEDPALAELKDDLAEQEKENPTEPEDDIDYDSLTEEQLMELIAEELKGEDEEAPVKQTPVQTRIDELTRNRREAERRAASAEAELERLRQVVAGDKEPNQEDFDDYSQYVKAVSKWAARQEKVAAKQEELEESRKSIDQGDFNFQMVRMQEGVDADPSFGLKADKLAKVFTPAHEAYHSMFESEQFVPMVQYLSGNLNEAQRIANLSPRAQAREIMRLEDAIQGGQIRPSLPKQPANVAQNSPLSRRTVSQAPAPVRTAGGRETVKKDLNSMTMEEFAAHRKKQSQRR